MKNKIVKRILLLAVIALTALPAMAQKWGQFSPSSEGAGEVGMTENEDRAHFTMWCMMASPLILGNDLRNMSEATRAIIMNKEMIAVDQDPLGVQGWHCLDRDALQFWLKPLVDDAWTAAPSPTFLINLQGVKNGTTPPDETTVIVKK